MHIADVIALAEPTDRGGFAMARADLFPAMVTLIATEGEVALTDPAERDHYVRGLARIRKKPGAVEDAMRPLCAEFEAHPQRRAARAEVLEFARLWFTAELRALRPADATMALQLTVEYEACSGCGGNGRVEAGSTGVMVDCPICKGAGDVKVPCPWRL